MAVISSNIQTMVDEWTHSEAIGNSHPLNKKKAVKQDMAIALGKTGKSRVIAKPAVHEAKE